MSSAFIVNITRFLALLLMQVLVFKKISNGFTLSSFNYLNVFIYPIFIMLLPVRIPHALSILLAFVFGISIDWFYDSLGVHAGACVFTAFVRPYILSILEPRGGYPLVGGPTQHVLGMRWFLRFSAISLLIHLLVYFSIQYFSFVYIINILISTLVSFVFSMLFIIMYQFLLNPKE
jgi:hypothetical protein